MPPPEGKEAKEWGAMWEIFHLLHGRAKLTAEERDKRLWVELQRRLEAIQHGNG